MFVSTISKDSSLFLGVDLAYHIVAVLLHGYFLTETSGFQNHFNISAVKCTQKEIEIICYRRGHVFATLSRKIINSTNWNSKVRKDNLEICWQSTE